MVDIYVGASALLLPGGGTAQGGPAPGVRLEYPWTSRAGEFVTTARLDAPGPLNLIHAESQPDDRTFPFMFHSGLFSCRGPVLHMLALRAISIGPKSRGVG